MQIQLNIQTLVSNGHFKANPIVNSRVHSKSAVNPKASTNATSKTKKQPHQVQQSNDKDRPTDRQTDPDYLVKSGSYRNSLTLISRARARACVRANEAKRFPGWPQR